jgi:hypothetical protein
MKGRDLAGWLALRRSEQIVLGLICLVFLIGLVARSVRMEAADEKPVPAKSMN